MTNFPPVRSRPSLVRLGATTATMTGKVWGRVRLGSLPNSVQLSKTKYKEAQSKEWKVTFINFLTAEFKRIQLKIYKRMSDKLNKYSTEVDFKGYILKMLRNS